MDTLLLMETDMDSIQNMKSNPLVEEMEIYDHPTSKNQVIKTFAEE